MTNLFHIKLITRSISIYFTVFTLIIQSHGSLVIVQLSIASVDMRMDMVRLFKRWRRITREWYLRTPRQKWMLIYGIGAKASEAIGVTVYGDMNNYWYSYFPGLVGMVYSSMLLYTVVHNFAKGDYTKGLQCTCWIGVLISVCSFI